MTLLERIKALREENGNISINRLEKEAGLTRGSMSKWDNHEPSYDKLKKVADYFNVSVEWLKGGTDIKEKKPTPTEGGGLSDAQLAFIEKIKYFDDDMIDLLDSVANAILARRGE